MATALNKQKTIAHILQILGKGAQHEEAAPRPVLEQFIYAICREGTTRDLADQLFERLVQGFFDWNEVRVSSAREVADAMDDLVPDAEARGQRIIDFLQEVFETTFSFDLEGLQKKGVKQAAKQLSRYQAHSDYTVASVIQHSMGGHAIPLDDSALRVLRRLGVIEEAGELEALRGSLEHQIPKAKGSLLVDLVSDLAHDICTPADPSCPQCLLRSACPTGADYTRATIPMTSKKPR